MLSLAKTRMWLTMWDLEREILEGWATQVKLISLIILYLF